MERCYNTSQDSAVSKADDFYKCRIQRKNTKPQTPRLPDSPDSQTPQTFLPDFLPDFLPAVSSEIVRPKGPLVVYASAPCRPLTIA